ncbi:hypothetical protein WJS89_00665 [Sphingomicrobium sp. XHP0235]|uniref:M61 family metallopeptidase n=1 Tax=Sphingomicrobium aquimarinum TaxID=3133971 RepID=UPI0031FEC69B
MKAILVASAAVWVMTAGSAGAQVAYHVDFTDPVHHRAMVSATFPAAAGDTLDVKMPDWRTGAYEIRDLANGVSQFRAMDSAGKPLPARKIDKQTWRIDRGSGPVTVSYELYANELTKRTRQINDTHAFLDASATFVYADAHRGEPVTVTLDTPDDWRSFSGMDAAGTNGFRAANFDVLVDSPIDTGVNESRTFSVGGKDYVLVATEMPGDVDKMAADLETLVAAAVPGFWSDYPFDRYVFMVHGTESGGGATEHMNSTVIQLPRQAFLSDRGYASFLGTASHEFVHTWNVKAYRPEALVPYDYDAPNYTTLFWVAEGSTSYFTDPLLLQAGLIDTEEMLESVGQLIHGNRNRPGRLVQSVAEASFDEWISPESPDRSRNDWVNIYSEGQMISWMLDLALLDATDGRVAYRDVHQALYARAKAGQQGFGEADMLAIMAELTGRDWSGWWQRHVHQPVDPDYRALLATVGLEMVESERAKTLDAMLATASRGGLEVRSLVKDGAAWRGGLTDGDVITSIDRKPATAELLEESLDYAGSTTTLKIDVLRRGRSLTLDVPVGNTYASAPTIRPLKKATARQTKLFEAWLEVPFPG